MINSCAGELGETAAAIDREERGRVKFDLEDYAMSKAEPDRRKAPRFSMRLPVFVNRCNGQTLDASTFSRDVSSNGIYFYMDAAIEEGTVLEFTLSLPPDDVLRIPIRVNYSGKAIRVKALHNGSYGVAASMESYGFVGEA